MKNNKMLWIGLGVVAVVGYFWWMNKKKSTTTSTDMGSTATDTTTDSTTDAIADVPMASNFADDEI